MGNPKDGKVKVAKVEYGVVLVLFVFGVEEDGVVVLCAIARS